MCGITPWHIHILCKGGLDGGFGFRPKDVGDMTLDQVLMLLADPKVLRKSGNRRTASMGVTEAAVVAGTDGTVKGRAADGTPITGRIGGKSLARQLMDQEAAKNSPKSKRKADRDARRARRAAKTKTRADSGGGVPLASN